MFCFFFFNDTATTEIYTLSLHDALPISLHSPRVGRLGGRRERDRVLGGPVRYRLGRRHVTGLLWQPGCVLDRKSTRLNSSHLVISYAVFCLKKKKSNNLGTRH